LKVTKPLTGDRRGLANRSGRHRLIERTRAIQNEGIEFCNRYPDDIARQTVIARIRYDTGDRANLTRRTFGDKVRLWHLADMATPIGDVRFRG
jgi:hypothetical protein